MAEEPPRKQKKPSRLTAQQKVLIAVCVLLAAALAAVLAYKSLVVRPSLPGEKPGKEGETAQEAIDYGDGFQPRADGERKSDSFYTVLILGRDTGGGGNTDTMLLASYDVANQKAAVMSIPRDTMVNVSWDVKKINSVYNTYGGGEKGIRGVYKEIAQLVGFEPDYQVVLEWDAVGALVDAIGGVYFDVPYEMDYHDPYQDLVIRQKKGYRLLSGDDAMQVIRWRQNDSYSPYGTIKIGDSGRMKLQQDFLKEVVKQMLTIQNVANINKIAKVFQENVETDLSFQNILWFAQQAVFGGLSVDNVEFFTMPYTDGYAWSRSYQQNLSYVLPDADQLLAAVNEKLSPFKEVFTLADLDIMSVNADGSLRSTSGHLEDAQAAVPPVKPAAVDEPDGSDDPDDPETEEPDDPTGEEDPWTVPNIPPSDENGNGGNGGGSGGNGGNSGETGNGGSGETGNGGQEPSGEPSGGEEEPPGENGEEPSGGIEWTVPPMEPGEP